MVIFLLGTFLLLVPVATIVFGIPPVRAKDSVLSIGWEIVNRFVAFVLLLIYLLLIQPRLVKVFEDFGTELPAVTQVVFKLSQSGYATTIFFLTTVFTMLSAEVVWFAYLKNNPATKSIACTVSLTTTALQFLWTVVCYAALLLPLVKLLKDLS